MWVRLDDDMFMHPKVATLSNAALGLWARTASWCARYKTKGKVPRNVALMFGDLTQLDELVASGLWIEEPEGLAFHDWEHYQLTPEQVKGARTVKSRATSREAAREADDPTFEEFWMRYPRKVGRLDAKAVYLRVVKKTTPEAILKGLDAHLGPWSTFEKKFIPHPATWLKQGRWLDEPPTPATAGSPTRSQQARAVTESIRQRMEGQSDDADRHRAIAGSGRRG